MPGDQLSDRATRLRVVLSALHTRLRSESYVRSGGIGVPQQFALLRISRHGPLSIRDVAEAERVTHQSMAQTIGYLREKGLVSARSDLTDRRRTLLEATPAGQELVTAVFESRTAWLAAALAALPGTAQTGLDDMIDLLQALVGSPVNAPLASDEENEVDQ